MFYRSLLSAALLLGAVSLAPAVDMYTGMGTAPGIPFLANAPTFGENVLEAGLDLSSPAIDITSVFPDGINIGGTIYTSMYVNNHGNVSFNRPIITWDATNDLLTSGNDAIFAVFLADSDTGGAKPNLPTPGGKSTGTNRVYWDLDAAKRTITVTWDDVGYYFQQTDLLNAFQLRITRLGNNAFKLEFRYENINWIRGNYPTSVERFPVAGWSAGDGVSYALLEGSGTADAGTWDTDAGASTVTILFANGGVTNTAPTPAPVTVRVRGDTPRNFALRVSDPDRDTVYNALWDSGAAPALPEHGALTHIGTPKPPEFATIGGYPAYVPNPDPDAGLTDGTYWVTSPSFTYTPTATYRGDDLVYYWVRDRAPRTATAPAIANAGVSATVAITFVVADNEPPVLSGQTITVYQNEPFTMSLGGSDPNTDPLSYSVLTPASHGTVSIPSATGSALSYFPANGYLGADTFAIRVIDLPSIGTSATAIYQVNVVLRPRIALSAPVGGETFASGGPITVTWASDNAASVPVISITISLDSGNTWMSLVDGTANDGSWTGTLPVANTSRAVIAIAGSLGSPSAISNTFTIGNGSSNDSSSDGCGGGSTGLLIFGFGLGLVAWRRRRG